MGTIRRGQELDCVNKKKKKKGLNIWDSHTNIFCWLQNFKRIATGQNKGNLKK